jgi:hypothetical protein
MSTLCWACKGGKRGVAGGRAPLRGDSVVAPPNFFSLVFVSIFGQFFGTWFFTDGFLFLVKELGLLTNPGHWIRVLDAVGSYMYIVL